ncbi:MAG TPA: DUF3313 domain-containing protein [Deltaproteobacteria bacterium]|nr:DUF3313 domain-containing protein [Deltaproteobacteria bacterium]
MRKYFAVLSCVILMVAFSACVSSSSKQTGFLHNYSKLQPDPEAEGLFFYENPKKKIYRFDAFKLAPILVYFDPAAVNHSVNPERLVEVTEYFRSQILQSFQGRYRIVPIAGPDVCTLRIAITGVAPEKPRMTATTNTQAFGLSDSALEVEFQDSKTGEPILAIWDTRKHGEYRKMHEEAVMRHAKDTIQNWIKITMNYIDKAYAEKPQETTIKK